MTREATIYIAQSPNRFGTWEDVCLCAAREGAERHAAMYERIGRKARVVERKTMVPVE